MALEIREFVGNIPSKINQEKKSMKGGEVNMACGTKKGKKSKKGGKK